MPSSLHEILVKLLHERPSLAADFVAARLGDGSRRAATRVKLLSGDLAQTSAPQHRADAVLLLDPDDAKRRLAVVVEVQLAVDAEKLFTWPVYLAGIRARLRCPAVLLVVTPYKRVREWASSPISLGPGGDAMRPFVLGPDAIPTITTLDAARKNPALALLSAIAHARGRAATPTAVAALVAAHGLDDQEQKVYVDIVTRAVGLKTRRVLEALMEAGYEYQSDFARKYVAEGEAKGEAKGRADALLAFLAARKLAVTKKQRQTILACRDLEQLDRWIARAVDVAATSELFG